MIETWKSKRLDDIFGGIVFEEVVALLDREQMSRAVSKLVFAKLETSSYCIKFASRTVHPIRV